MITDNKTRYAYNNYGVSKIGRFNSAETKISEESFDYDSLGRLTKNTYTFGTNTVGNEFTYLIDENTYNADQRIGSAKYKVNGAVKSTATNYYDSYKRIRRKLISIGSAYDREITYNQTRISKVMDVKNGSTINNVSYTYDTHGRITGESDSVNTNVNTTYVYDSFGQLIRENNKALDKTFIYCYDSIGNITSVKTYAYTTAATPSGTFTEQAYGYSSSHSDRLTSFGSKGVSYNTLGYPISHDGMSYVWTKGKLTRQYCGSKTQAGTLYKDTTFTYDAYGRRLSKSHTYDTNPVSSSDYSYTYNTTYDYDSSGRLVHETCVEATTYTGGSSSTREITYLYDESGIIGAIQTLNSTTTDRYYFDRNIRGDVIAIYNNSGTKIATYSYDSWGNCTTKTLVSNNFSNYNPIRYRGYYYDRETKLYYLNARYYNPQWRRFISPDDTSYLAPEAVNGLNLYAYCNNDPVNYCDPSGNLPQWAEWLIGGAVIGLAALGAIFLPGAAGVIMGAAFYGAVTSAVGGAVLGGLIGGLTGGWEGVWDGASNGFMWGAISGAVSGALTSGINIATGHLKIVGSAQKTGSLFHQFASNVQAGKMSLAVGRYSEIHLNRSKGLGIRGFRPDVTGVTKKGLRVVEVVSTSQTYSSQVTKIGRMMGKYSHITSGITLDALHLITNWFIF